jgi:MraZ protein
MSKIAHLNRFVKANTDFIRKFTAGVKNIDLDSSDRIQIPKDLKGFAELSKEVVICGAGEIFEIWNKEYYEAFMNESEADFATLAEEVMGKVDFGEN